MKRYRILSLILVVALCLSATTAFAAEGHRTITDVLSIEINTPSGHCDCPRQPCRCRQMAEIGALTPSI